MTGQLHRSRPSTARLISDEAASAYVLRQWMQHDVRRVATMILWRQISPADGLAELQGIGRMADIRARRLDCSTDQVTRDMLIEEYRRQAAIHAETRRGIVASVLAEVGVAGRPADASYAAAAAAKAARLPPPPHVFAEAIEFASYRLWQSRRTRA